MWRYFFDGNTFSFNEKDDPGKTIIFIDNLAYESIVKDKDRDDIKKYIKGSRAEDIFLPRQGNSKNTSKASPLPS